MATYIERSDEGFIIQLVKFCNRVDTYSATLGLDPIKVQGIKDDKELFTKIFEGMETFRGFAESLTNYKILLRYGNGDEVLGPIPTPPIVMPPMPMVTAANAQKRFAKIIQDCVKSPNYTVSIGEDLGIEAPVTPFVPGDGKPEIKPFISDGGLPGFKWNKGKYQGIEVWINTGTDWKYLDKDFKPHFVDKISELPASGTSAVWKYKCIYLYKEERAGQWSEEISVTIYGAV